MARATTIAAAVGRSFAYFLIAVGVLATLQGAPGGLWLALIGLFLILAGRAEEGQLEIRRAFSGHRAGELASFPAVTVPAGLSAAEAIRDYFNRYRYQSFPVVGPSGVLGLVTISRLEQMTGEQLERTPVEALVERDPDLLVDEDADIAELLERAGFQSVGRAIVVGAGGRLGILSATEIQRALRASRLTARPG